MSNRYNSLISHINNNNYSEANKLLEFIIESKIRSRVSRKLSRLDEGLFDRIRAKASGTWEGVKSKGQNIKDRVTSTSKAISQNVRGLASGEGFEQGIQTVRDANKRIKSNDPLKKKKSAQADSLISSFERDLSKLYPDIKFGKVLSNLRSQINFSKTPNKIF